MLKLLNSRNFLNVLSQVVFEAHVPAMGVARYVLEKLADEAPNAAHAHASAVHVFNARRARKNFVVDEEAQFELRVHRRLARGGELDLSSAVYALQMDPVQALLRVF